MKLRNKDREVVFRYSDKNTIFYSENGERKKCHRSNFYALGLKPVE